MRLDLEKKEKMIYMISLISEIKRLEVFVKEQIMH